MVARAVRVTDVEPNPEDGERTCTSNGRGYHPFTAWTPSAAFALKHANKHGPAGVVLSVPMGAPPENASWSWEPLYPDPDWDFNEPEVVMRGSRVGVEVLDPSLIRIKEQTCAR